MAETYKLLSTGSYVLALVFLALAVFLFFKFNIRKVIGDLSGRNAKKSINAMKVKAVSSENASTDVIYKREINEVSKEFTTGKITQQVSRQVTTGQIAQPVSEPTARTGNATTVLEEELENSTTVLGVEENATTVLSQEFEGTTVLSEEMVGTTVLSPQELRSDAEKFIIEKEIVFIHGSTCLS